MVKSCKKRRFMQFLCMFFMAVGIAACLSLQPVSRAYAQENPAGGEKQADVPEDGIRETAYTDSQGIEYVCFEDGACYVKGAAGNVRQAAIPQKIDVDGSSYTVKGIIPPAFQNCGGLEKLEVPNTVTDIQDGTFSGCKGLEELLIIPAQADVKRDGNTVELVVKVNSELFYGTDGVSLQMDEDFVKEAVSDSRVDTARLVITVVDSDKNGNCGDMEKSIRSGKLVLTKQAVQMFADNGLGFQAEIRNQSGKSCLMKVDAQDLEQVTGELCLMLAQQKAEEVEGTFPVDYKKALRKNGLDAGRAEVLAFSLGGGASTSTEITFPAEIIGGAKAGSSVYVYRYEKTKRVFTALSFHPFTVTRQGKVKISLSKGGMFVVSAKPFQSMGAKLPKGWLRESGSTYYIDKNGNVCRGWRKIGSGYYYFDRKNGKMAAGRKVDGVTIAKDGRAEQAKAEVAKIRTMIKARDIVSKITKESDSKSQKAETCFRWIFQFPYRLYRRLQPIYKQPGWEVTFANDIFDHQQGCCVSEASALAFLFHECGYETVYVACDTGHAWVELNGRVYDPLFAEARGFDQFYNVSYSDYGLYAVLKRKI